MTYTPNITRHNDDGSETPMTLTAKSCTWKLDGDGGYYVGCGDFRVIKAFLFDFDGSGKHHFAFCPYCGGKLEVVKN